MDATYELYQAPGLVPSDLRGRAPYANVRRVIVVGPGAAGKSTLAIRLGEITGLPVIELDKLFWRPDLAVMPRDQWAVIQRELASQESWIMDGDLGPTSCGPRGRSGDSSLEYPAAGQTSPIAQANMGSAAPAHRLGRAICRIECGDCRAWSWLEFQAA